ncbi:MAG: hypothetical protein RNU03_13715 [Candidatus Sedimenticola sp. (ex Thyasira tokunagai)]
MITILPLQKVLSAVAVVYALALILVILALELKGINSILAAFKGAFILELFIIVFVVFWWRKLWSRYPALNQWVYPDLNGEWIASIHWNRGKQRGTKTAKAHIKQNLFRLNIELVSDESESETLMVIPKKDSESSRPMLYYIYRNESKQGSYKPLPPHNGAAILKLDHNDLNVLKGNYFTDRATNGHFELQREK